MSNSKLDLEGILTPNERWEQGTAHDERSLELYEAISQIDMELNNDFFYWKSGGDGDNGEQLLYILDCYFEAKDKQ